jgi:hypothetical protein
MNFFPEPVVIDVGDGGISMISGNRISGMKTLPPRSVEILRIKVDC